ncbi:MAG: hypothetical protein ACJ0OL_02590 [Dehalococcoidia bacterium]|tara:strand:+ start:759 stop:1004 length:246 start_codon:yes stop_codon:yes gene_type:complete
MEQTFSVHLDLDPKKFGAILACIDFAAQHTDENNNTFLLDLSDELRDSQKQFLNSMSINSGNKIIKQIQSSEKTALNKLID